MNILCLHHNDADGRASAAIARRALGKDLALHEINYGDSIPWEKIEAASTVLIVDFSLPADQMQQIAKTRELIWIDHHISALQELEYLAQSWPGIRDTAEAACTLTWRYFFPDQPVPKAIVLIGDRDIWRWAETDTGPFDEGLHQENTDPANDALWVPLLSDDTQFTAEMIERGRLLRKAKLKEVRRKVNEYGFPVTFEGHRTLAINTRGSGDIGEYVRELGYQLAYCYVDNRKNGAIVTFVSLYSATVDVSKIAQKFGGGGHRGASGFSFTRSEMPFPPESTTSPDG